MNKYLDFGINDVIGVMRVTKRWCRSTYEYINSIIGDINSIIGVTGN